MGKRKKKKNHVSISERDIKSKLYGQSREPLPKEKAHESKITEKDIMRKLYPAKEISELPANAHPEIIPESKEKTEIKSEQKKEPADLFASKTAIQPGIQEEIDTLKQAIKSLEDKLKTSLDQKERLKVKLVQKRKLINIRERLADLILNRMPEKFILLLIFFLIFGIFVIIRGFKPVNAPENKTPANQIQIKEEAAPVIEIRNEPILVEKKKVTVRPERTTKKQYTIQAAEYADEQAAERFINALKMQGYTVNVDTIYRDKKKTKAYFKINVGAYDTLSEAKKFNEAFRKKTNIKDSFIKELKR